MPGDLVGGKFPLLYPFDKSLGLASNASQVNLSPRSNIEWLGWATQIDEAAALVTNDLVLWPVPVENGDVITKVSVRTGATPATGPTHQFAAIYSGVLTTAALQGKQSADGTSTAIAASTTKSFTLPTGGVVISPTNAPFGYVYAAVSVKATTAVPSLVGWATATACQGAWFTNAPTFLGARTSTGLTGVAPATVTLATVTKLAVTAAVVLS